MFVCTVLAQDAPLAEDSDLTVRLPAPRPSAQAVAMHDARGKAGAGVRDASAGRDAAVFGRQRESLLYDQLAASLSNLGISSHPHETPADIGRSEFVKIATRCVEELEEMKEDLRSGRGTFEIVDKKTESITLAWNAEFKCHEVLVSVKSSSSTLGNDSKKADRQKALEVQMSQFCFVKQDQLPQQEREDAQVYTVSTTGKKETA